MSQSLDQLPPDSPIQKSHGDDSESRPKSPAEKKSRRKSTRTPAEKKDMYMYTSKPEIYTPASETGQVAVTRQRAVNQALQKVSKFDS
jgi:hypothetical protein